MSASAGKRSFWPTVLLGALGAGAAAIAGSKPWVHAGETSLSSATGGTVGEHPEVTAVALVALASWGVLLVTRGWVRRGLAVLAAIASLAAVGLSIQGLVTTPEVETGLSSFVASGAEVSLSHGAWGWIALIGAVLATLAAVYAVRAVGAWPEMGRRYDAPVSAAAAIPETPLDWWKAMDEGRDPTADPTADPTTDPTTDQAADRADEGNH